LGNRIGTNAAGTAALGNGAAGIDVEGAVNVDIGDSTTEGRNLISANQRTGIFFFNSSQSQVDNNIIGTDITSTQPMGNFDGIEFDQSTKEQVSNCVIGGNQNSGILLKAVSNSFIQECFIGVDPTRKHAIGNSKDGVEIIGASTGNSILNNTIAN